MKGIKGVLIASASMMVFGIALMAVAVAVFGKDVAQWNPAEYTEKTHVVTDKVSFLNVIDSECDVRILPAADENCTVVCADSEQVFHTLSMDGQTLTVERVDSREWYERIEFFVFWPNPLSVTVYLPEGEYRGLTVKTASGDVQVPEGYEFWSAEITSSSGDVSFESDARDDFTAKTSSGDLTVRKINVENVSLTSTSGDILFSDGYGDLTASAASGDVEIVRVVGGMTVSTASGDVKISESAPGPLAVATASGSQEYSQVEVWGAASLSSSSGNLVLNGLAVHEDIKVKTSSGDVEGTFLGDKRYSVKTGSGSVRVPESRGEYRFEIETSSGDVDIEKLG